MEDYPKPLPNTVCAFHDETAVRVINYKDGKSELVEYRPDWKTEMNSVRRKLTYDLHSIFCKVQSLTKIGDCMFGVTETTYLSRRYRSAIQDAIRYLNAYSDFEFEEKVKIGDDLLSAQIIWSLFEAVSVRPANHSVVLDLMEWGRECAFPPSDSVLTTMLDELKNWQERDKVETHRMYWNALLQQVLCGKFKTAAVLLKQHSKFKDEDVDYERVVRSLEKIELALSRNRNSCAEFIEIQKELRPARAAISNKCHEMKFLCSILLGEAKAFIQCSHTLDMKWYEILPTYLLFANPTAKMHHICGLATRLHEEIQLADGRMASAVSLLDKILFAILSLDCLEALKLICSAGMDSLWLAAHLVDLISNHDHAIFSVSDNRTADDCNLQTRIITNYANMLFASDGMWDIAIDYYLASGTDKALKIVDEMLAQVDWKEDVQIAERIVGTCERYGFHIAKCDITRAVTLRFLRKKEWSAALCWALRNGSVDLIALVSQKVLEKSSANDIAQMRIFDAMSESFLITPDLLILYKFYNYKRRIIQSDLIGGISVLHELFVDNSAPDVFFITLLQEISRLLQTFTAEELSLETEEDLDEDSPDGDISDDFPSFNTEAIENLLEALGKFEYFYSVRRSSNPSPEKLRIDRDIKQYLLQLRPRLLTLLASSFFTDQIY